MLRDLMFVSAWLVLIPLALQAGAQIGVLLWAWSSLLAPQDVLHSFAADYQFARIAAIVTIGLMLIGRGGGIKLRLGLPELLLICLGILSTVAQATSPMEDAASGWDLNQRFLKILALAFVTMAVMTDRARIHALVLTICLSLGFNGVAEGGKFLLSGGAHQALGGASLGDNNQLGLNILLSIPLIHYLYNTQRLRITRLGVLASGLFCILGVVATYSRGAAGGLAIVAAATALSSRRKVVGVALVGLLAVAALQVVGQRYVERIETVQNTEADDSFLGRVEAWKVSAVAAIDRPFGTGMHGIQHPNVWYTYLPAANQIPILPGSTGISIPHAAHSIWFEVLGDMGFGGLFCFATLVFTAAVSAWRTRRAIRRANRPDLEWASDLALRLQLSLLAFVVSGSLLSASYYDEDYLIIGLVVVLGRLVRAELGITQSRAAAAAARAWQRPVLNPGRAANAG